MINRENRLVILAQGNIELSGHRVSVGIKDLHSLDGDRFCLTADQNCRLHRDLAAVAHGLVFLEAHHPIGGIGQRHPVVVRQINVGKAQLHQRLFSLGRAGHFNLLPAEAVHVDLDPGMSVRALHHRGLTGSSLRMETHRVAGRNVQRTEKQRRSGGIVTANAFLVILQEGDNHVGFLLHGLVELQIVDSRASDVLRHLLDDIGVVGRKSLLINDPLHIFLGFAVYVQVGAVGIGTERALVVAVCFGGLERVRDIVHRVVPYPEGSLRVALNLYVADRNITLDLVSIVRQHRELHQRKDPQGGRRSAGQLGEHRAQQEIRRHAVQELAVRLCFGPSLPGVITVGLHFQINIAVDLGLNLQDGRVHHIRIQLRLVVHAGLNGKRPVSLGGFGGHRHVLPVHRIDEGRRSRRILTQQIIKTQALADSFISLAKHGDSAAYGHHHEQR